jgi:hypothetical protein
MRRHDARCGTSQAAVLAEPLYRRLPEQLTLCVGNELTLFVRGIVPGRDHPRRTGAPKLREIVLIAQRQATGKPVVITELGFAACRDADNPELLGTFNATPLSMVGANLPAVRRFSRPRVRAMHPRDESAQSRLLVDLYRAREKTDLSELLSVGRSTVYLAIERASGHWTA